MLLKKLDKYWRIVMTGVAFLLFGSGGLLFSIFWFNLLRLCIRDAAKRRKIARLSISMSFRLFMGFLKMFKIVDYRILGRDLLQQDRGCLQVANHPTLLDYVILASIVPDLDCVVKADLLKNPFLRGVVLAADYLINNENPSEFLDSCKKRLENGGVILIFPEGTRTRISETMKIQRGAAHIAVRCDVNIRLIKISCIPLVVTKERRWYQVPPTKAIFTVEAQELIDVRIFMEDTNGVVCLLPTAARKLTAYLKNILIEFKKINFGGCSNV